MIIQCDWTTKFFILAVVTKYFTFFLQCFILSYPTTQQIDFVTYSRMQSINEAGGVQDEVCIILQNENTVNSQ